MRESLVGLAGVRQLTLSQSEMRHLHAALNVCRQITARERTVFGDDEITIAHSAENALNELIADIDHRGGIDLE